MSTGIIQVAAVVVPKETGKFQLEDLKSWCKEHSAIAPYSIPTVWKTVESMPRNAMGKVNKKDLVSSIFPSPTTP